MIEFLDVSKFYSNNTMKVFEKVNFKLSKSEIVFLTGKSGSGKTTLLELILHSKKISSGTIKIEDQITNNIKDKNIYKLRRKIGVVFQNFKIFYNKSVYDNVAFPLNLLGYRKDYIDSEVENILKYTELWYKKNEFPHKMSGGEQQKIALARAIVTKPKILLADEPTGNLDYESSLKIIEILYEQHLKGTTVIISTHDTRLLELYPDTRILKIENGIIGEK